MDFCSGPPMQFLSGVDSLVESQRAVPIAEHEPTIFGGQLLSPIVLFVTVGLLRGALWSREVRVLSITMALLLLYALGSYTPAFGVFFAYLPGASFFRRPVDATFLLGALFAIVSGYIVHLWASAALPFASHRRSLFEIAVVIAILIAAIGTAYSASKTAHIWKPLSIALLWMFASSLLLAVPTIYLKTWAVVSQLLRRLSCSQAIWRSTTVPISPPLCLPPTMRY